MRIQALRNATLLLELGGATLLIDPMLAPPGALPPVGAPTGQRNPLTALAIDALDLVDRADIVLVSHMHRDHFDADAAELLPADIPIFTQPASAAALEDAGFRLVTPVEGVVRTGALRIERTAGQHAAAPELSSALGPVSGFIVDGDGESVYLVGDSIICDEVRSVLAKRSPPVVVVNAGAGELNGEGPISMTSDDVLEVAELAPDALIIAVHMEALGHCPLRRTDLRAAIANAGLDDRVLVPNDGDAVVPGSH